MLALQAALKSADVDHRNRRAELLRLVQEQYGDDVDSVVLFSPCDIESKKFEQDSYFFYFSGIVEPASAMVIDESNHVLYKPQYTDLRSKWVADYVTLDEKVAGRLGFDSLQYTGDVVQAIHVYPYFDESVYKNILQICKDIIVRGKKVATIYPANSYSATFVKIVIDRLSAFLPELKQNLVDVSLLANRLRRKKDMAEIEMLHHAAEITDGAFHAAVHMIKPGSSESEVQAALEYIFTENKSVPAYASIVAGGKNATILHYVNNDQYLQDGDVVLIDAGARYNYYCSDVTRSYPVSGEFSDRQKEVYQVVLDTQKYIASQVRPGMWLSNKENPEMSLQHLAMNFLKERGYNQYYNHGIGHFLGLDVHDVGNVQEPLSEGDVITIEPGVYIADENLGIRIEDDYWVVEDGEPVCLSQDLPKEIDEVEAMMQQTFDVDQS